MTDNEIIKALECCSSGSYGCENGCPLDKECDSPIRGGEKIMQNAFDLINHQKAELKATIAGQETLQKYIAEQKAEIERLQSVVDSFTDIGKMYSEIKAEAYKEFAESEDYVHKEEVKKVIRDYAIAAISKGKHELDAVDDVVSIIALIDNLRASSEESCTLAPLHKESVWSALMRTFLGGK